MKVTCSLPNASENINGIDFERQEDGSVVAVGVSAEDAANFGLIPGFIVEEDGEIKETASKGKKLKSEPVV